MKNEAVFVDCSGVFFLFYEDEDIVGRRLIKLKSIGGGGGGGGQDQTCVKEPFSQDREATQGAAELWGGYLTVRVEWARESDGGGRGEIGLFFGFRLFFFLLEI